jgi:predicted dithiol-disulfide oxidoreductase (DUF899 family)
VSTHRTGTREEWRRARLELLELEKEQTRRGDELARMRRELPWVRLDKAYAFETDEGTTTLAELFDGRSQLLVWEDDPGQGGHGLSSFALEDGVVYHVYSTYARGTDVFNTFYQLLDRAPKGRDEDNIPPGQSWWRRHDECERG